MINQNIEFKEAMLENDFDMAMNIYKLNREKYDAEILAIEAYVEADKEYEIYTESFSDITKGFIDKSKRIIQAIIDNIIKAFNFIWRFFSDFIKSFFNINFKDKLVKQAYEISLCNLDSLRERVDISCSWCKNYTSKAYEFFDSIKSDEQEMQKFKARVIRIPDSKETRIRVGYYFHMENTPWGLLNQFSFNDIRTYLLREKVKKVIPKNDLIEYLQRFRQDLTKISRVVKSDVMINVNYCNKLREYANNHPERYEFIELIIEPFLFVKDCYAKMNNTIIDYIAELNATMKSTV